MQVAFRHVSFVLIVLTIGEGASPAADPSAKLPADEQAAEYASPKSTYRTYIEAVRKNDTKAAKQCWAIDDANKSGALDTIVGLWISMRQINQVAEKKFGAQGLDAILKGWRRDDLSDRALNLTKERLDDAEVKITGDTAALTIKWRDGDGYPNCAFEFCRDEPRYFRKVSGNWKIDANKYTGLDRGADFFEKGTWGRMFRDQVTIMNEAIGGMQKNELKSAKDLEEFIEGKIAAMTKRYEEEIKKEAPR